MTTYGADMHATVRLERSRGIKLGQVHYLAGLPIGVGTEIAMVDVIELPDRNDYEAVLHYEPSTYFAIAGGANVLRVLERIDDDVEGVLDFFSTEPALVHPTHSSMQFPEERELAALSSLRARLRVVSECLEGMDSSPGVVMPDPYRRLAACLDDLKELWETEFSSAITDDEISRLLQEVFDGKQQLEADGMVKHDVDGFPALERFASFAELLEVLKLRTSALANAVDERLARGGPLVS